MSYVLGNLPKQSVISLTLSPTAVSGSSATEQSFTVQGLQVGDHVVVNRMANQSGIGIVNARVSAANELTIMFCNFSGESVTPTANTLYRILVSRPDRTITDGVI